MSNLRNCGIVGYGVYIPRGRISVSEIASVWKKNGEEISRSLGVSEKAVASLDEDAVTMAVAAASQALFRGGFFASCIEALYVGSESHPYVVNPSSTIVGEVLGVGNNYMAADLEFACKAGTAGIQAVLGLLSSEQISYGMAIGADSAQAKPHDILEYTSGAGAGAFLLGRKERELLVRVLDFASFSSDTPDFWRRDGVAYPSHGGRFTGEPAYFAHVMGASLSLLKRVNLTPSDIDYCVFHMPNGKFPKEVALRLGFSFEQLKNSLIVTSIGNPYSASSLLGLAQTLDLAKPKQKIFMVSYGSGAGADAFLLETTELLPKKRKRGKLVNDLIEDKVMVSYTEYLKRTRKI